MKRLIFFAALLLSPNITAYAEAQPLPVEGAERIRWAAECCGRMPVWLYFAIGAVIVCVIAALCKINDKDWGKK